ncbi:MAG TPA: hypothetical protein VFJ08_02660, partial [Salinisphaera sp.]|nr:hypothetical protein [Salinisphaera sp.]
CDPLHKEKRDKLAKQSYGPQITEWSTGFARFSDNGELWYCVHLIRKNAPWINKIFLVTDNQRPSWLTLHKQRELDITVVDHAEIFKDHLDCLPTFNSQSIETMLFNIPGLSKSFVYFNDDCFIVKKTTSDDFFRKGKPVVRARFAFKNYVLDRVSARLARRWLPKGYNGWRSWVKKGPWPFFVPFYLDIAHTPQSVITRELECLYPDAEALRDALSYRFRVTSQIAPIAYISNLAVLRGAPLQLRHDWAYFDPRDEMHLLRKLDAMRTDKGIKFLCTRSLDTFSRSGRERIVSALGDILDGPRS